MLGRDPAPREFGLIAGALLIGVLALACDGDGDGPSPGDTPDATNAPTKGAPAESPDAQTMCAATPSMQGSVASNALIEISGIAASRKQPAVLWAHNDSGDSPRAFAIGPGGQDLGAYPIPGAGAIDWEAMAIGPGPDEGVDYLYFGDIGDNDAVRPEIAVYSVPEPVVVMPESSDPQEGFELTGVEKLSFTYPDRPHDAETLLVDPDTGDLLIVTKELQQPASTVFRAPAGLENGSTTTLEQVAEVDFQSLPSAVEVPPDAPPLPRGVPHLPTAGDVSPDGSLVAIRTYGSVWVWDRPAGAPLAATFSETPCEAPSAIEPQGEAIAFQYDGYTTISEGETPPINHFRPE